MHAVYHGSELSLIFGPVPTPIEDDFANQLTDFYINFVNDLKPGGMWIPIACTERLVHRILQPHGRNTPRRLNKSCSCSEGISRPSLTVRSALTPL